MLYNVQQVRCLFEAFHMGRRTRSAQVQRTAKRDHMAAGVMTRRRYERGMAVRQRSAIVAVGFTPKCTVNVSAMQRAERRSVHAFSAFEICSPVKRSFDSGAPPVPNQRSSTRCSSRSGSSVVVCACCPRCSSNSHLDGSERRTRYCT